MSICTFVVLAQDAAIQDAIYAGARHPDRRAVDVERVPITNPEIKLIILGRGARRGFRACTEETRSAVLPSVLAKRKTPCRARAETIRALARATCDGRINFEGIAESDDFLARLCEIPGIGHWTAQYVAMRALGEPDAFPSGDLGLLRALEWEVRASLNAVPRPGGHGGPLRPCIFGTFPANATLAKKS